MQKEEGRMQDFKPAGEKVFRFLHSTLFLLHFFLMPAL
jgi:hypothetical protein